MAHLCVRLQCKLLYVCLHIIQYIYVYSIIIVLIFEDQIITEKYVNDIKFYALEVLTELLLIMWVYFVK